MVYALNAPVLLNEHCNGLEIELGFGALHIGFVMPLVTKPFTLFANWKMAGDVRYLKRCVAELQVPEQHRVVIMPPAPFLAAWPFLTMSELYNSQGLHLGAQNVFAAFESQAFTGRYGASMLKEVGCGHVLLGHSERRKFDGENDTIVRRLVLEVLESSMVPVVCVGEDLEARNLGKSKERLWSQLGAVFSNFPFANTVRCDIVIAYEPIWSVGAKAASAEQIQEAVEMVHTFVLENMPDFCNVSIVYGGGVDLDVFRALKNMPNLGGVLVGRVSHDLVMLKKMVLECN